MEASTPPAHNSFWCQINGFNDVYAGWHVWIYAQSNVHVCVDSIIEADYNPNVCESRVGVH